MFSYGHLLEIPGDVPNSILYRLSPVYIPAQYHICMYYVARWYESQHEFDALHVDMLTAEFISSRGFSPVGGLYPIYMPVPPFLRSSVDIFVVCRSVDRKTSRPSVFSCYYCYYSLLVAILKGASHL